MTDGLSRTRLALAVALVAAAGIVAVLVFARGADGDDGRLAWKGTPALVKADRPTDHILYGEIRNDSLKDVNLDYKDVRVLDTEGGEVRSAVRFLAAFAHGLYPWSQRPDPLGEFERRRLGEIVTIKPGQAAPITLSWRVADGAAKPAKVDFGEIDLSLPDGA